jgi:hypothetical protein
MVICLFERAGVMSVESRYGSDTSRGGSGGPAGERFSARAEPAGRWMA